MTDPPSGRDAAPTLVTIWQISLDQPPSRPGADVAELSPAERARADTFVAARDRARWLALHVAARRILGAALGVPPAQVAFTSGAAGKPALACEHASDWEFNLSDSGALGLLAMARGVPLGVDVELMRRTPAIEAVATAHFSVRECAALQALAVADRTAAFYRCWTRKEAYIKALGTGLGHPLESFSVSMEAGSAHFLEREDRLPGTEWSLHDLPLEAPWVGALALPRAHARIVLERWRG
jgi:4'-phosphopantetheinyl transferase